MVTKSLMKKKQVYDRFAFWGDRDPLYKKMCEDKPETDPDRSVVTSAELGCT